MADDLKIGQLVQRYIPRIFRYCETADHNEFERLCDFEYSKQNFNVNFPFCKPAGKIGVDESRRYWTQIYVVRGVSVRVTSQWYDLPTSDSRSRFLAYLRRIGLSAQGVPDMPATSGERISSVGGGTKRRVVRMEARYRGNAIGNAQNLLIRNILSNLGGEGFSETDWRGVIDAFGNACAYCGAEGSLVMDHIIPINREALGEHRLGNLVPACRVCNEAKAGKDFRKFLRDGAGRIAAIEAHMERHNYVPIGDNEQVRMILDLAHKEIPSIAERYIRILNSLLAVGDLSEDLEDGS